MGRLRPVVTKVNVGHAHLFPPPRPAPKKTSSLRHHPKPQQSGLPAFVQHAELEFAAAGEAVVEDLFGAAFGDLLAVEKPPAFTTATQGGKPNAQRLRAVGGLAQVVAVADADNGQWRGAGCRVRWAV